MVFLDKAGVLVLLADTRRQLPAKTKENPKMSLRATHAVIDLTAIRNNVLEVRKHIPPDCKTLVVVKGNAYGLGVIPICRMLGRIGVYYLGIAALSEAVELRRAQINLPILMFTEGFIEEFAELLNNSVTQTVFSFEKASDINVVAGALGKVSRIHLKVDTGMGRIGCTYDEAYDIVRRIKKELSYTDLEGIYTHFPVADEPDTGDNVAFTLNQIDMLAKLRERLERTGIHVPLYHCANSGAVINFPSSAFDMVRIGISAYGCQPSTQGKQYDLMNVLTSKTKVIFTKRVSKGTCISYGREYVTERETTIATLPVGYADGYPRALSNCGQVLINGKEYRIAGRVCMDQCMVDVGNDTIQVGDEVILISRRSGHSFDVEKVAQILGTIPYEIMCSIAPRVPRIHVGFEGIDTA